MVLTPQLVDYTAAVHWVASLAARTVESDLDDATPCSEYSVRALLGHLIGTAHRSVGTARAESTRSIPHVVTDVPDRSLAATYASVAERALTAWSTLGSDEVPVVAPWGTCSALAALRGFTVETLVHGWDLATATQQDPEGCRDAAHRALAYAEVPERLVGVMYAAPRPVAAQEGPTTRLARALGRGEWTRP